VLLLGVSQFALFPRHDRDELWREYVGLPHGSLDVLFLGSSLVHANVNPTVLWGATGIRAYCLSGSEQSLPTTRSYLREALRTQEPKVVVLDLHMFSLDNASLSENQKRSNFTMMPLGIGKVEAVAEGSPAQEWTRYFIPLEQFHTRWDEVSRMDFNPYKWRYKSDNLFLGYRVVKRVEPQQLSFERRALDERLYTQNHHVVSEIIELAEQADAKVLLIVGPSSRVSLHDDWTGRLRQELAIGYPDVGILETQLHTVDMGVDRTRDYYDQWHLNARGAEKYSVWIGTQIAEMYGLPRERSSQLDDVWRTELARYRALHGD